jgi:DNA-binding response OmpR family regulator
MKQILIVEDDSFLNKMLDYNLTADGYGVTSALNARTKSLWQRICLQLPH